MNVEQIKELVTQKCGQSPLSLEDTTVEEFVESGAHPDVLEYVTECLPPDTCKVSQVRLLPWKGIVREMGEGSAPGLFIRPYGYLIVATSVGGNVICLNISNGRVFWADHDSFSDDMIMFLNRTSGEWQYLYRYSPENVERAMVHLSDDLEDFLVRLLTGQLTGRLDALD